VVGEGSKRIAIAKPSTSSSTADSNQFPSSTPYNFGSTIPFCDCYLPLRSA
jgi:hypothetical protein